MRALDLYGLARAGGGPRRTRRRRAALEAYADGVNAWLRVVQEEALGRGAPEFFLFTQEIAPWLPADSIAVQKLMALQMTDKAALETLRAQPVAAAAAGAAARHPAAVAERAADGPAGFSELFPGAPGRPVRRGGAAPARPAARAGPRRRLQRLRRDRRRAPPAARRCSPPTRISALTAPSIWMLARLDLASGPVIGGTIPGIPAVLVGRSDALAWGLTSSYLDDQDVYIERLDPDDPGRYLTPRRLRAPSRPARR